MTNRWKREWSMLTTDEKDAVRVRAQKLADRKGTAYILKNRASDIYAVTVDTPGNSGLGLVSRFAASYWNILETFNASLREEARSMAPPSESFTTGAELRRELRRTGFSTVVRVTLDGPTGPVGSMRVAIGELRRLLAQPSSTDELAAQIDYSDPSPGDAQQRVYRTIWVYGWQPAGS